MCACCADESAKWSDVVDAVALLSESHNSFLQQLTDILQVDDANRYVIAAAAADDDDDDVVVVVVMVAAAVMVVVVVVVVVVVLNYVT